MGKPLRVLLVEDSEDDVLLTIREIKKGGYDPVFVRVEDAGAMRTALQEKTWDVILCDYQMPQFDGLAAISLLKKTRSDIPLIILSGAIGEDTAVECMRLGAHDYIMKDKLARLVPAIERELKEAESRRKRRQAEEALRENEERFRVAQEVSPDGFTILSPVRDANGRVVDFTWVYENATVASWNGTDPEAVVGKRLLELFPGHAGTQFMKAYQLVAETGEQIVFEDEYRGETIANSTWLRIIVVPTGHDIAILAQDITTRKRAEEELQRTLESLRKSFGATIQVMVSAIEVRDPYTAGHQTRSAGLARAIATEMGLPQEKIEAIRMAGPIHDIGKLSVPAEILSKPTQLTNIEFSLIKEHARTGSEMLKDVESPWPLAEIVYQHHERMDGSGYPRSLKGDAILMEARILAVADVVESMASHRPYRPSLGIDAALEEIEKNKGILYDNAVADACLRLFREKGFQL